MFWALEAFFALLIGALCLLLSILVEIGLDHGFPDAGQLRAAEGRIPDAEPVGAGDDGEVLRI